MRRGVGSDDIEAPELTIPVAKVCFIIAKAHGFDVKVAVTEPDTGSNPTDDNEIAVLQDHDDDPVREELGSLISELSVDEQIDLVALTWLGRDDGQCRLGRGSPAGRLCSQPTHGRLSLRQSASRRSSRGGPRCHRTVMLRLKKLTCIKARGSVPC